MTARKVTAALAAVAVAALAVAMVFVGRATVVERDPVKARVCAGVAGDWDRWGCGYAEGVEDERKAVARGGRP